MINVIIFLFILGVLIIVHEFGHFIVAKKLKVRVEIFSLGLGPTLLKKKKNDTEYCISAIPVGGYVKLAGDNIEEFKGTPDEYLSRPPRQRAMIVLFGPLLNYILGFLCFWSIFLLGYPTLTTKVGSLIEGYGAKDAGIQIGDQIISIDAVKVDLWEDLQKIIQAKKGGTTVKLSILRDNKEIALDVKVKEQEFSDALGQMRNIGLIGITPSDETVEVRHGFIESFFLSVRKIWDLTITTYKTLWRLLRGKLSLRDSVTGPLGIFYITSKATHLGITALLYLVAGLNVSLAIFNLLPFPILDGGHILLLAIERIRGRAMSLKVERIITQTGVIALVSLAIVITYNDFLRFFGDKILKWLVR